MRLLLELSQSRRHLLRALPHPVEDGPDGSEPLALLLVSLGEAGARHQLLDRLEHLVMVRVGWE
jgi:hypothetical protein